MTREALEEAVRFVEEKETIRNSGDAEGGEREVPAESETAVQAAEGGARGEEAREGVPDVPVEEEVPITFGTSVGVEISCGEGRFFEVVPYV